MKGRKIALGLAPFLFLITLNVVSAQNYAQVFEPFMDLLGYIFYSLAGDIIFRKFLIWMLVFTIFAYAVRKMDKIFPENTRRQGNIIAFVLALISTLGMPDTIINLLFDEYAMVVSLILYLIVPALIVYATRDQNPVLRGAVLLLFGILLMIFAGWVSAGGSRMLQPFVNWLFIGSSICIIAGIIMMVMGITGGVTGGPTTTTTAPATTTTTTTPATTTTATPPDPTHVKAMIAQFIRDLPAFEAGVASYNAYLNGLGARPYGMPPAGPGSLTGTEVARLNALSTSISPMLTNLSSLVAGIRPNMGVLPAGDPDIAAYTAAETRFNGAFTVYSADLTTVAGRV
jgi:hypothetical protein